MQLSWQTFLLFIEVAEVVVHGYDISSSARGTNCVSGSETVDAVVVLVDAVVVVLHCRYCLCFCWKRGCYKSRNVTSSTEGQSVITSE